MLFNQIALQRADGNWHLGGGGFIRPPLGDGDATSATNINPYLADAPDVVVRSRTTPVNGARDISYGSMMIDRDRSAGDDEGLIISGEQREKLIEDCAELKPGRARSASSRC